MKQIAVIRLSSLGDIVCTGPAVRALKAKFPDSKLVFVTKDIYRDIATALPGVDEVSAIRKRGEGFRDDVLNLARVGPWDRVVDLQGSNRSKKLVSFLKPGKSITDRPPRFRRALLLGTRIRLGIFRPVPRRMAKRLGTWGVKPDGRSLELIVPDAVWDGVKDRWGDGVAGSVVLVPGAKHATKCWPDEYWAELVEKLPVDGSVIILGNKGEFPDSLQEYAKDRILDLTGETGLLEAAAVLQHASLVISGDTGPMHMTVAVGAPLVAMFGPTVREFGFYPYRHDNSIVLERRMFCRPCSAHGSERCPLIHHKCMREITPDMVIDASKKIVNEPAKG
ncbi:lipopolysaccharide core heptosyltransferase RfaQ [bacterium BMS3Bbin04]|nr:lipopolysaccharide core heptosyltransferase RfaQ [bacterium BMS3Bbin04]